MQKDRNLINQDFRGALAWSITSGHIESQPKALPDYSSNRTPANSTREKSSKIHLSGGVGILQSLDTSCIMSLDESQSFVLYTLLHQLRSNRIGRNNARTILMTRPASQVVDTMSCQPTGVHEVDGIDSLRPAIFSFFIKPRKLGAGSCASCLTLSCLKKNQVLALALFIPVQSVVIVTNAWY